jgi:hypothetical protein
MWFLWVFLAGISSIFCMEFVEEVGRELKENLVDQGNTCGATECDRKGSICVKF